MKYFWRYLAKLWKGLSLTFRHLTNLMRRRTPISIQSDEYFKQQGLVTIKYPQEQIPVPDNGRYQLHLDIEDCIGCDQCARICPVNCIEIETIRSVESLGTTSDGTPKRLYIPKFDIDMAKCCFCGLCTVVCPTECLIMTKDYDYSTVKISDLNFHWQDIDQATAEIKKKEWENYELAKKQAKIQASSIEKTNISEKKTMIKIVSKSSKENLENSQN
jgi:NADH-quinone oxidoreductase subunit I